MMTKVWMVMLLGITIGCGSGTPSHPDTGPAVVTERRVDPSTTGPGITNSTGQHFVVAPALWNRTGILLVFLPGTGGRPDFYTRIARHAAERGHHAVGLAYPNAEAVNDLCASAPSSTCQEEVRVEIITGAPRSSLVSVDVANSIDNRLRALLSWLDRTFPTEGWSAFLTNGEPRWDRVIVAGHSQGGGHAAMIARLRVVHRAVLFAATEPAPWTTSSFATSRSQLYGFVHRLEPSYAGITASWRLMDIVGPIATVDGASSPFAGSHQLQTNATTCRQVTVLDSYHSCIVVDVVTPLGADGQPTFGVVWSYLLDLPP
jgi:hypothetical protein